jgi:hypothetical protein
LPLLQKTPSESFDGPGGRQTDHGSGFPDLEDSEQIAAAEVHHFSIFDLLKRIDADICGTLILNREASVEFLSDFSYLLSLGTSFVVLPRHDPRLDSGCFSGDDEYELLKSFSQSST